MKITKRRIEAEVSFIGSGKLTGVPHTVIFGGVPKPKIGKDAHFTFAPDDLTQGSAAKQAFQINLFANSSAYRKLGEYFLSVAELDTSIDTNYHEHLDVTSEDGTTEIHLIVRKSDTGDFT